MSRYAKDPYWITTKYPSQCAQCGGSIVRGERSFYYPNGKYLLGSRCKHAEQAAREFAAAALDEEIYSA